MQILQTSLAFSTQKPQTISSSNASCPLSLLPKLSFLSLHTPKPSIIRMGGGPRTYPGGVSKWQWKRMQAKKAKQLLKARLCRERQIYEMRKRAELKAAVSELERPWEVVQRAAPSSTLFSVSADEQLKVLADRFQKPGGFDLWSDDDGPQLFATPDGLPTARFFPKGVVHSVKPYGRVDLDEDLVGSGDLGNGVEKRKRGRGRNGRKLCETEGFDGEISGFLGSKLSNGGENGNEQRWSKNQRDAGSRKDGNGRKMIGARQEGGDLEERKMSSKMKSNSSKLSGRGQKSGTSRQRSSSGDVYDMSLQRDGSYGFCESDQDIKLRPESMRRR